jgi:hypothetical protein
MNTYRITNLTNTAGKRDFKFNSQLDIEYVDNMIRKTVTVKPGASLYLTVPSLPMSVHKLRAKNLISVVEVSAKELADSMNNAKPKPAPVVEKELVTEEVTAEETAKRSSRKKKE